MWEPRKYMNDYKQYVDWQQFMNYQKYMSGGGKEFDVLGAKKRAICRLQAKTARSVFFWGRWLLLKTRPFVKAVKRVGFHTKDRASSSLAEQRTPGLKGNSSLRNVLPFLWVEPSSFGAFFYSMMTFVSWIRINWSVTSPFFIGSAFLVAKCQHLALPGSNGSNGAQGDFQLLGDPLIGIDWDSW